MTVRRGTAASRLAGEESSRGWHSWHDTRKSGGCDVASLVMTRYPTKRRQKRPLFLLVRYYNDVIMGAMASQIISLTIVCSTVYSRRRSKKTSKLRVTGLCAGNSPVTGEFPTQMASNAENVPIWWRLHDSQYHRYNWDRDSISTTQIVWFGCFKNYVYTSMYFTSGERPPHDHFTGWCFQRFCFDDKRHNWMAGYNYKMDYIEKKWRT